MDNHEALIVDGNAIIYRAYFASQSAAIKNNKSDSEIEKNIYKTINSVKNMLISWLNKKKYAYGVVVFDSTKNTFRKEKFNDYKANRPSMPMPLFNSLNDIKKIVESLSLVVVPAPSPFEGDDVICTLSKLFEKNGISVDVISTDKDLLQIVSYHTTVKLLKKGKSIDYHFSKFIELTEGLMPYQIPQLKAIAGDSSDNYKGVPGIGEKIAKDLLIKYKNIENIYKNLEELNPKIRQKLSEHRKEVELFFELAVTVNNVEVSEKLDDYRMRS